MPNNQHNAPQANGNIYAFRSGRSLKNVDPQVLGEELERIRREKGALTAETVLSEAEASEDSPLRPAFEWDDTAAARAHRLGQARRMIVSVRVINSPVAPNLPAYVSVRTPEHGRNFVPVASALSDEQITARALDEVRTFIESLERRYANFRAAAAALRALRQQTG